ncbi:MAG: hypothetical protein ACRECH_00875 [Nitrososphaerales archaeon]
MANHSTEVTDASGKVLAVHAPCATKPVLTNPFLNSSNSPNGGSPSGGSWVEDATFNEYYFTGFSAQWNVPAPPSSYGNQIIYLFPGLEPIFGDSIIQPVLQWGSSSYGSGQYYVMADWYFSILSGAYHTPFIKVNSGDTIGGFMAESSGPGSSWTVGFADVTTQKGNAMGVSGIYETQAFVTLEQYNVQSCSQYPNTWYYGIPFSSVQDQSGHTGSWNTQINLHGCGEFVSTYPNYVNLGID